MAELLPFDERDGALWFDGKIVPWRDAKVHVLTHALHFASCVFEGERMYSGRIYKLKEHTERLFASAAQLGIAIPYTEDEINRACYNAAEAKGYSDALMFDYRGLVAEATGANVFFVKDGQLHTPTPDCFLDGITRRSVMALAAARQIPVRERAITRDELPNFSECFLTGTAAEVTPVAEIGPYRFKPGNISELLMNDYAAEVRRPEAEC